MDTIQDIKNNIIDVVRKGELQPDGWDIYAPSYFIEMGFDPNFIKGLTVRNHSGEGKYQLYTDNKPVDYIDGVYYLDLLEKCASLVVPDYTCNKVGRGFRARAALSALQKTVNGEKKHG